MLSRSILRNALLSLLAAVATPALAQEALSAYPSKPVRVIVPAAPGGAPDVVVRTLSQRVSPKWGQQFVVDNRPGATGAIGVQALLQAPADGYTLLMGWEGIMAINPLLSQKLRYSLRDFAPISLVARVSLVLVAHPSFPPDSLRAMIEHAKARPGAIPYGSAGNGQLHHLAMELLKSEAGIDLVHVPYKGGPAALQDVVAGQVPMTFIGLTPAIPLIRAGKLKAFGVTGRERAGQLPDVPTVAETLPAYGIDGSWLGFFAPAATAPALVARISADLNAALADPELRKTLFGLGMTAGGTTPEAFAETIRAETERYRRIIDTARITASE
jgi:tripartite-type tricarboxylate transporter receptor subunit TctC